MSQLKDKSVPVTTSSIDAYYALGGREDSPEALAAYAAGKLPHRIDRLVLAVTVTLFCTLGLAFSLQDKQPLPLQPRSIGVALPFAALAGGAAYIGLRARQLRDFERYTRAHLSAR